MKIPDLDDDFMEHTRKIQKGMVRNRRRQYIRDHLFDILNLAIAILALLVALAGLYLPQGEQPPQVQPEPEGQYQAEEAPREVDLQF